MAAKLSTPGEYFTWKTHREQYSPHPPCYDDEVWFHSHKCFRFVSCPLYREQVRAESSRWGRPASLWELLSSGDAISTCRRVCNMHSSSLHPHRGFTPRLLACKDGQSLASPLFSCLSSIHSWRSQASSDMLSMSCELLNRTTEFLRQMKLIIPRLSPSPTGE